MEETKTVEAQSEAIEEPSMTLEEAASILTTILPRGSFKLEVAAWVHDQSYPHDSPEPDLDITIRVWSSELSEGYVGATLREAVMKCRDAVAERLARNKAHAEGQSKRRSGFNAMAAQAEGRVK